MQVYIWNKVSRVTRFNHFGGVVVVAEDLNSAYRALEIADLVQDDSDVYSKQPSRVLKLENGQGVNGDAFIWPTESEVDEV